MDRPGTRLVHNLNLISPRQARDGHIVKDYAIMVREAEQVVHLIHKQRFGEVRKRKLCLTDLGRATENKGLRPVCHRFPRELFQLVHGLRPYVQESSLTRHDTTVILDHGGRKAFIQLAFRGTRLRQVPDVQQVRAAALLSVVNVNHYRTTELKFVQTVSNLSLLYAGFSVEELCDCGEAKGSLKSNSSLQMRSSSRRSDFCLDNHARDVRLPE